MLKCNYGCLILKTIMISNETLKKRVRRAI